MTAKRATPLLAAHRELGARIVEFAGWDMPLQYSGIVAEHNAVRSSVGVFDVTHLGKLRVAGRGSTEALQEAVTADVEALEPGRATYALVLTDAGGCVDDVFVYKIDDDDFMVVPNAANVFAVAGQIRASGAEPTDEWDRYAILAIQGPDSFDCFTSVFPDSGAASLELHAFSTLDVLGEEGIVARTGYTGERGFELYAPSAVAERAFRALLGAGAAPVGLGARDTLRLEMGYALYGHELTLDTDPLEARLGWVLAWHTPFRGRDAAAAIKERGPARRLVGIRCSGRGVPRQGYAVVRDGERVGEVTSGNYSPTLGTGIAMAYVRADAGVAEGDAVGIEARGRVLPGDIVKPPFIDR